MGYFQVRYNSRVVNYDRRGFIRLATGHGYLSMVLIPSIESHYLLNNALTYHVKIFLPS